MSSSAPNSWIANWWPLGLILSTNLLYLASAGFADTLNMNEYLKAVYVPSSLPQSLTLHVFEYQVQPTQFYYLPGPYRHFRFFCCLPKLWRHGGSVICQNQIQVEVSWVVLPQFFPRGIFINYVNILRDKMGQKSCTKQTNRFLLFKNLNRISFLFFP